MLLNRIPLRLASAAGAATVVAGAAFGVAAFADSGPAPEPEVVASDVAGQSAETPFFDAEEQPAEASPEEQREQAEQAREEAADGAATEAGAEVAEEEEEPEPESDSGGGGSGDGGGSGGGSDSPSVPSGSPRDIARQMLSDYGWGSDQFSCLDNLWQKESNWDHTAQNPSSGAYGIPQALPGSKMESAGSDWQTNPATQIEWGLGYIEGRYGSPCAAWSHSQANNWY